MCCDVHVMPGGRPRFVIMWIWRKSLSLHSADPGALHKRPFFALKIDMMKAYDRVEWDYLHGCLTKLGFAPSWIQSVMRCVTCVRYAVRVNGELPEPVVPSRGIRQGDLISPYLFLLCT